MERGDGDPKNDSAVHSECDPAGTVPRATIILKRRACVRSDDEMHRVTRQSHARILVYLREIAGEDATSVVQLRQ
ncbi:hypothetical protein C496_23301 [Natronorubrum tibetense GA33]|uniref:Uncharacterized protein n=1 Tax=Natronorubrum tibetense GA33 TaxID=1114856 RepID=L9VEE2_9EURY|nr:hypothetical protein C496_23301 [Natronorubrum tibetense GA33]